MNYHEKDKMIALDSLLGLRSKTWEEGDNPVVVKLVKRTAQFCLTYGTSRSGIKTTGKQLHWPGLSVSFLLSWFTPVGFRFIRHGRRPLGWYSSPFHYKDWPPKTLCRETRAYKVSDLTPRRIENLTHRKHLFSMNEIKESPIRNKWVSKYYIH